ncbi:ABC transporter substrate-binding protein [Alkalihalobacillus sp. CinArs1]|uniref:ABC transporter substrate-binding protein n=1 Tax=Alkalihalobacillus sp. CinArs1 TaxID=2995314 RepID=UPI0022DD24B7|nr:ABC transporter substrate-binding protein [Alkalihalobacillus sp. CinArs1]
MTFKPFKLFTFALLFLVVLAGCGSSTTNSGENTNASSGPVEIEFWHAMSGNLGEELEAITKEFNEKHEDINVKLVFMKDYPTITNKFQLALQSKQYPALLQLDDATLQTFASSGHLHELNDSITESNLELDDYVDGFIEAASQDDSIYGLPLNRSVPMLYYRKDIFEQNGIDPSRIETWEGVRSVSNELVEKGAIDIGFEPIRYPWFFSGLAWSNGAELGDTAEEVSLNSPEAKEALQFWGDMIHKDGVSKVHYGGEGWAYWYDTIGDLSKGKAAMVTGSTADMAAMDENIGAAFFPKFEGEELRVPIGGSSGVIPKEASDEQKQAAFQFMTYFSKPEVTAQWSKGTGYLPVRYSAKENMQEFLSENPNFEVAVDELKYARPTPLFPKWNQVETEAINKAFDQVFVEGISADKALDDAQKKAENIVK